MRQMIVQSILIGLVGSSAAVAQTRDQVFVRRNSAEVSVLGAVKAGRCTDEKALAGRYAKVVVIAQREVNKWEVTVVNNDRSAGMALINNLYCITAQQLDEYFKTERGAEIGAITIPFKFRLGSSGLTAGNALGPYIGRSTNGTGSFSTYLLFGGLTNVAVNALASEAPKTNWGIGLGTGWVFTVGGESQIGIIGGYDFVDAGSATRKDRMWLSLGVGYAFLSKSRDKGAGAKASEVPQ